MPKIIIASGPVIVRDGQVLLNKHGEDDFWKFCGGQVEDLSAEGLRAAAIREAREEIGVTVNIINPDPFIMHVARLRNGEEADIILVHYLAEISPEQEIKPGPDIREVSWLAIDELEQENLGPNILAALRHFKLIDFS